MFRIFAAKLEWNDNIMEKAKVITKLENLIERFKSLDIAAKKENASTEQFLCDQVKYVKIGRWM